MHMELPKFTIMHRLFSRKVRVKAKWDNGDRLVIGGFHDKSVAEYWLETEAAHWLTKGGWLSLHNDDAARS
jgi:hypothetical protein